jgi:hypothetical protein
VIWHLFWRVEPELKNYEIKLPLTEFLRERGMASMAILLFFLVKAKINQLLKGLLVGYAIYKTGFIYFFHVSRCSCFCKITADKN